MTFTMLYDSRNRANLDKLADHSRIAAYKWYQYCIDKQYQVLIYETIRTKAKQAENVKKGASQTMKSYHIVGQALDFVFTDSKGNTLWAVNNYVSKMDAINYAKKCGFTWGGDWDNDGDWRDETFLDSPHLQYEYKGYGTDTYGKIIGNGDELTMSQYNELKKQIEQLQKQLEGKVDIPSKRNAGESHKEAWQWLTQQAITNGNDPQAYVTREQFASLLRRYHDKFVK